MFLVLRCTASVCRSCTDCQKENPQISRLMPLLVISLDDVVCSLRKSRSTGNSEKIELSSLKHAVVYVGFEHECPHGHRFILTPKHLRELGSPCAVNEESHLHYSSTEKLGNKVAEPSKLGKNGGHGKVPRHANGMITTASKDRNTGKLKEIMTTGNQHLDGPMQFSLSSKGHNNMSTVGDSMKDIEASLQSISLEDVGSAFSLLNRSLPVYMNCLHCRKNKKDPPNVKFPGTISQLQRIFLVTPAFPVVLAACLIIQFEEDCFYDLPYNIGYQIFVLRLRKTRDEIMLSIYVDIYFN